MWRRHKKLLQNNRVKLVEDLEPGPLLNYLFQEGVFSDQDLDVIKAKNTRRKQAEELLDILPRRGPCAFDVFCDALKSTVGQEHLVETLSGGKLESGPVNICDVSWSLVIRVLMFLREQDLPNLREALMGKLPIDLLDSCTTSQQLFVEYMLIHRRGITVNQLKQVLHQAGLFHICDEISVFGLEQDMGPGNRYGLTQYGDYNPPGYNIQLPVNQDASLTTNDQPLGPTSVAPMLTSQPGYDNSRELHNIQGARPKTTSRRSQLSGSAEIESSSQGTPTGVGNHPLSGSGVESSNSSQSSPRSLALQATAVKVEELCIRVAKLSKGDEQAQMVCEPHEQHCAVKAPCCGKLLSCQECHEGCGANQNARKLSDEEEKEGETDAVTSGI